VKHLSTSRIQFIDIARLYGVSLVYYGHFIESCMKEGSAIAAVHYKFIYSFHMPLFFILSGFIAKDLSSSQDFATFIKRQLLSRLLPYAFLTVILLVPTFWVSGFSVGLELPSVDGYIKGLAATFLAGFPFFNIPTWFLICLFVVESMHYFTARYLNSQSRIIGIAFGYYLIGSILAWNAGVLNPLNLLSPDGKIYPYFMILEAFTAYSLYLVGVYLRRKNFLVESMPLLKGLAGLIVCLALVYFTYDLNKGMFTIPSYDAVVMVASSHGNPILFPITAIIGSVMIMLLARLSGQRRFVAYLGANTLVVFGLNGVFYHFINDRLAALLLNHFADGLGLILVSGVCVTVISMALTVPFVYLFNALIPQLIGKPRLNGPLIPQLLR
jgi:acyltransferase